MAVGTSIQPVILSGGSGSRLWPLSREQYPKQLLSLAGEGTLLQQTLLRLAGLPTARLAPPLLVCNECQRFLVADQLRKIKIAPARIILEPVGRNTAPALTVAALAATEGGHDPLLLTMPADHVIGDAAAFQAAVQAGAALAEQGHLVTFGVPASAPETGYGYIRCATLADDDGATPGRWVDAFVEKPDQAAAESYIRDGHYLWNSGVFLLRASVWLQAVERHCPDILQSCTDAHRLGQPDQNFYRLHSESFAGCPSDSIDYAVMEKVVGPRKAAGDARCAVLPLDAGWSDVGEWNSLWKVLPRDGDDNVVRGDVEAVDTRNALLIAGHRMLATLGVDNLVVVETADAVLVAHRERAQDVKKIVERLKANGRTECQQHRRVLRPWGSYEGVAAGERFQVKRIVVKPGDRLSLQMHHHRAEHWVVVRGTARVTRGDECFIISENESTYIPLGVKHRLENPGTIPLEIIEIQSGSYLGEDDIVRFDDVYGRGQETPTEQPRDVDPMDNLVSLVPRRPAQ